MPTKPTQGEATKKSLIDAMIDEIDAQAASTYAVSTLGVISNGSFELGTVTPSGWTFTAQGSGTGTIDTTTSGHGAKSFKMVSAGGGGANGGGSLEMNEFSECSPQVPLLFRWLSMSSVAGVKNMFEVDWFETADAGDFISTTEVWSSDNNPTDWKSFAAVAVPPSTARFFKIRLTGCDSTDATAGSAWFDYVSVSPHQLLRRVEFSTAGTFYWMCPAGVSLIRVSMTGGGGSGSGSGADGGSAGGTGISWVQVTPGMKYTVVIGAGGVSPGNDGADSTFETSVVIGAKGIKGTVGGSAGGSGTGDFVLTGGTGEAVATGGAGGSSAFGYGGAFDVTADTAIRGGGGGSGTGSNHNNGGSGYGLIEY
jgi:hypothetical protein